MLSTFLIGSTNRSLSTISPRHMKRAGMNCDWCPEKWSASSSLSEHKNAPLSMWTIFVQQLYKDMRCSLIWKNNEVSSTVPPVFWMCCPIFMRQISFGWFWNVSFRVKQMEASFFHEELSNFDLSNLYENANNRLISTNFDMSILWKWEGGAIHHNFH